MQTEQKGMTARRIDLEKDWDISDSEIFNTHMSFYSGTNVEDPFKDYREQKCSILLNQVNTLKRQLTKKKDQLMQAHEGVMAQCEQSYNELLFHLSLDYNKFISRMNDNKSEVLNEYQRGCEKLIEAQNQISLYLGSAYLNSVLQNRAEEEINSKLSEVVKQAKAGNNAAAANEIEAKFTQYLQSLLTHVGGGAKSRPCCAETRQRPSNVQPYNSLGSACTKPTKPSPRMTAGLVASSLLKSSPIYDRGKTRCNARPSIAALCQSGRKPFPPARTTFPFARKLSVGRKLPFGEQESNIKAKADWTKK